MKTFKTLLITELKLSFRGMDMLIFAICMPIVLTIVLGMLYGDKPAYEGASYTFLAQSFGALITIAICAGGVMGIPLVISEYRHRQILKRFYVTPISPLLLLGAHLVIYALYAMTSLVTVYLTAKIFFAFKLSGSLLPFVGSYLLVMLAIFSIGTMVGGLAKDQKTAGILASILYFPMLIFSGATLPYEVMPTSLQHFADILPLTQGIKLLKSTSLGLPLQNTLLPIILLICISIICITIAIKFFKWD